MKKLLFLLTVLASILPMDMFGEERSGISLLYWSDSEHVELEYGQTYTSAEVGFIKSGSLAISEDGMTLTFDNLDLEYSGSSTSGLLNIDIFNGFPKESNVSIVLKGENKLQTTGYEAITCRGVDQLTITGSGSLETNCDYIAISLSSGYSGTTDGVLVVDNTSVTCQGGTYAVTSCSQVIVKNARFEGNIISADNLTLEDCLIKSPYKGWFDTESRRIKDENGGAVNHFIITTEDDKIPIPSNITFCGKTLMCGQTYTQDDFSEIKNGSFTVSESGKELILDQLETDDAISCDIFVISNVNVTVVLKGDNVLRTDGYYVMSMKYGALTITGDGSLTTCSNWFDFWIYGSNVTIENTTLKCEGDVSFGNNMWAMDYIYVKNSDFSGKYFFRIKSLTLIGCEFTEPSDVLFYPEDNYYSQLRLPDGTSVHSFRIQPVEGDFSNVVSPLDFDKHVMAKGKGREIVISMKHEGEQSVESISYVISYNGADYPEKTIQLPEPFSQTGYTFTVPVPFPAWEGEGEAAVVLTVTKVNGQPNTSKHKSAKGLLTTVDNVPVRRIVVEEFTGTWCGWCTRGTLALNLLNEEYGDNVITIAVHDGDPMQCDSYSLGSSSFPSARVNRGEMTDPYYGNSGENYGIKEMIDKELQDLPIAGIDVHATWDDESQKSIRIQTESTFLLEANPSDYGIAYVLMEDGMKGRESGWAQQNYYAGSSIDDPNMLSITKLPSSITDCEYNYVAVDAWNINQGTRDSFSDIKAGVPQESVFMADISSNSLIQDKTKLSVVALLIDKKTGLIVNAAKTTVKSNGIEGKTDINNDNEVNVTDVVTLISYIAKNDFSSVDKNTLDLNGDGNVDVTDVVTLILMIGTAN